VCAAKFPRRADVSLYGDIMDAVWMVNFMLMGRHLTYTVYRNKCSGGLGFNRFYAFSLCNPVNITLSCSFADKPALKMRKAA